MVGGEGGRMKGWEMVSRGMGVMRDGRDGGGQKA